ncbi:MAG: hypothetical protein PG981_000288 [Wolbachia endosymbiont of Ctenocephalides orientis wCori]|nr:MAG: hypothetical protein PG981_000288 [Wolbachia endosymbiont of Ctenocephalides orientis wCori]
MLKQFLVICGYILQFVSFAVAIALLDYLLELLLNKLAAFFLAKTSSEMLAVLGTIAVSVTAFFLAYGISVLCTSFTEKVMNSYQSFKNENSYTNIFSEVYNDPTIGLKDKVLFFSIYLIYGVQLPFLYCASKVSELYRMILGARAAGIHIFLPLINAILLIPVVLLELIKYPLVKLFSPLGLNVHQLSFLFNVSDVGAGDQSVHTSSFERSVIKCAKELKDKHGVPSNELDEEFKNYISSLTNQQKEMIAPYLRLDGYETGSWVNWQDSQTDLTLTQAVNLVLTAARQNDTDVELLKSILLVRFEESNRQCGPGMLNRIIYALRGLEAKNNFEAQLEPNLIGELSRDITKRFFEKYVNKHYYKIKTLKENFDNLYLSGSVVDLSNTSDEVRNNISCIREKIKEFVFKEIYIKFYDDYGQHIQRGCMKEKLRELITDVFIDSIIYAVTDDIEIPEEPATYFERVKTFFGGIARFFCGLASAKL